MSMQRNDVPLTPGATFENRYEIVAQLAEGGLGAVHEARQLSTGQRVALKTLRLPEHGAAAQTGARIARFLREAQLCAQLRHPNIVQIVDSGEAAHGTLYIAFAFAPGDNLAALLAREGALAPGEARHLMLQVLDALACAHAGGVVHRDLKPSNIQVLATGARRNAVVLDFGIGAAIDDERSALRTAGHDAGGTPGYGAPEQWRGEPPSPRADLFSWGLVFLECLTGEPVYRGTAAEMFYRLLGPDPVPIPAALERHPLGQLIAGAVRKDACARDVTACGLLEALDACDLRGLSREALLGAGGHGPTGSSIALPIAAPGGSAASDPTASEERRQLTALCCRVAVHPAGPISDPEAQDGALRSALAVCMEIGRDHGGCVAAVLGGDLLLYFGYPQAAEDDARRAARAARAITGAVDAENPRIAARGIRACASAGLHSGPVIDGTLGNLGGARLVTGATPQIAAHLASLAAPGVVLASAGSQVLLRAAFDLAPQAAGAREGIAPGMAIFRLLKQHGDATSEAVPDGTGVPMSGRDRELGLLMESWRHARGGSGQSSLVTGEPGIGKSRLARALRDRVAHDAHRFLEARCSPDTQHSALAPVIDLLERALGLDQESGPDPKIARLERVLAGNGAVLMEAMPLVLPLFALPIAAPYAPLDVSPQRHKALTLQAIVSLLFAMATQHPVLLLAEDLHWADPTTMELLSQLVREAPEAPMCLVMTARPEFSPSFSTAGVQQIPLGRLERAQTAALVTLLVGGKPLPPEVSDYVSSRSDGVPLFAEELFRMMIDAGLLVERDDRYELTGSLAGAAIPGTLRALLTARLDRLGRARETARLAAALGREFSLEVLSAGSPLGPAVVAEDLEQLMRAGLVLRKRRGQEAVGVFKHALVRDAAYDTLSADARQKVHARIARTLEARFPEVVRTRPDLLAHHHAAAEQNRQAVGYGQRAAEQGLQRSTYAEAIAHATRVVAWAGALPGGEAVEAELTANGALIQALMATRGWAHPQVKAAADRSAELMSRLDPDNRHHVPTLWFLFTYHHVASNRRAARAVAEKLVGVAERSPDPGFLAAALMLRGLALFIDGDHAGARPVFERAIALYDPERHRDHAKRFGLDTLVMAKSFMAHLRWFSGDTAGAFALVAEAIAWARVLGHVPSIALGLLYGCTIQQRAGDRGAVLAMATEILTLSARYGLPAYEGYAATLTAWAADDDPRIREITSGLTALGCKLALSYYGSLAADGQARRGEFDAAIACIDHCLSLCDENGEHFYEPELHRRRAMYEARKDPAAEGVRTSLERAARLARRNDMPRVEALATLDLLRQLGGGAQHRARLAELLALHPGLHALPTDRRLGGTDEHGPVDAVSHHLPALDRRGVGQPPIP
jgi:TOMM system kinase/cyclase fusion protein